MKTENKSKTLSERKLPGMSSKNTDVERENSTTCNGRQIEDETSKSEEECRAVFDSCQSGLIVSTLEGKITSVNPAACQMLGYESIEEMIGMPIHKLYEEPERKEEMVKRLREDGYFRNVEGTLKKKDGSLITVLASSTLHKDAKGKSSRVVGSFIDITQQKETERALRESEVRLVKAQQVAHMGFLDWDLKTNELFCSDEVYEIYGVSREEAPTTPEFVAKVVHPDDMEYVQRNLDLAVRDVKRFNIDHRINRPDGKVLWVHAQAEMTRDADGNPKNLLGTIVDITERKEAEKALNKSRDELEERVVERTFELRKANVQLMKEIEVRRETERALREGEERYRTLTENIQVGINRTTSSGKGKFIEANAALVTMFGYDTKEDLMKVEMADLYVHPVDRQKFKENMAKKGFLKNAVFRFKRKNGGSFWGSITAVAVMDEEGRVKYYDGIIEDVTARKKAEDEMKKRLMKFKLDEGKLYLAKESFPVISLEAFKELLKIGYQGTLVSRTLLEEYNCLQNVDIGFLWLAEHAGKGILSPRLKDINQWMETQSSERVILIDRLDYILSKNGFKKTLSFVQELKELAYLSDLIVILSLDPSTLSEKELTLLEKETAEITPQERLTLPENMAGILREIREYSLQKITPSYTQLRQKLVMSRPTLRKWVHKLISKGYVVEFSRGRSKCLKLTEKGQGLI